MSDQFSLTLPASQAALLSNQLDEIRILETALLTSQEPLPVAELKKLFDGAMNSKQLLTMLDKIRNK